MSKNQWKRQLKYVKVQEAKRRKKEHERSQKLVQAKEAGRDLQAERLQQERNQRDGTGWARRNERWRMHFDEHRCRYRVAIDCSFDEHMSDKEINSLASQLRYCYAENKRARHPIQVTVTGLQKDGRTMGMLRHVAGLDQWHFRAFDITEKDIDKAFDKDKLVYLTSDSDNVLNELQDDKVYIIGGIVDRNRLKRAAMNKAESLGIATARLPISDHLNMVSTKVLTTNHVFNILLRWRECDKDWKKTLLAVLPQRKAAEDKRDSKQEGSEDDEE
jgi:tRNA (guanine9-N1)-methyltransferase